MPKKKNKAKDEKGMYLGIALFVLASVLLAGLIYPSIFTKKIESGVKIAGVEVGDKTEEEAFSILSQQIKDYEKKKIKLKAGKREYALYPKEIGAVFNVDKTVKKALNLKEGQTADLPLSVSVDSAKLSKKIKTIAKSFNVKAKNASLGVSGGKVVALAPSVMGREIIEKELASEVQSALEKRVSAVTVPVKNIQAEVNEKNLEKLGLKKLVSRGQTNFSGSPSNRRHNVATGSSKFDGVLIKPGESFSFNKTLGPVDASTGYLPELVILEKKTVPQYGGGLCQVSSTAFRAALNAGLPILYRVAHAYPVVYYKPYGVDATVYLPDPDLVFKNDTGHYILIQTYISGDDLYFDFYGTKKDVDIKFAGNKKGTYGVSANVEGIKPVIYDKGKRGKDSFTAVFYRFIYDKKGKLLNEDYWVSKYDSPKKYPH